MKKLSYTVLLALPVLLLMGLAGAPGALEWSFLLGPYANHYDDRGIPVAPLSARSQFPEDFWERLGAALPESRAVMQTNPDYIADDTGANIVLTEEAEVFLTFLHEGAGYSNSVGFFPFDPANPPTDKFDVSEVVVLPNCSFYNSGGGENGLFGGETVSLGTYPAGTHLGFFVAANGWRSSTGVSTTQFPSYVYYTLADLNSEEDPELRRHTVLLTDGPTQSVVLGLEDLPRSSPYCDHDFNDAVFTVTTSPPQAFDTTELLAVPEPVDTDGDGVVDGNDDFPNDPDRAFIVQYPYGSASGTLAFEDLWPRQGDYDMNDLVLRYRFELVTSASGAVKDLTATFRPVARGADYHNGFALQIPGAARSSVASASLSVNGVTPTSILPEAGQTHPVFVVFNDAHPYTYVPAAGRFFNTEFGASARAVSTFELTVEFTTPQAEALIGAPPYNPFIYRTGQRGLEVHLPDHPPTDLADLGLFGTEDDDSIPASSRYYKTGQNLPWALDLPTPWVYPSEMSAITQAYHGFAAWAESSGATYRDWYVAESDPAHVFANAVE